MDYTDPRTIPKSPDNAVPHLVVANRDHDRTEDSPCNEFERTSHLNAKYMGSSFGGFIIVQGEIKKTTSLESTDDDFGVASCPEHRDSSPAPGSTSRTHERSLQVETRPPVNSGMVACPRADTPRPPIT